MPPAPLPLTPGGESRYVDRARLRESLSPDVLDPALHMTDLDDILQSKKQGESIEFLHLLVDDLRHEVGILRTQLDESEQECVRLKMQQEEDRPHVFNLAETKAMTSDDLEALSPQDVSALTIAALTRKIEELSVENTNLMEEKVELAERVQELQGENEANRIKIGALELQFKAINKTRQKAVQRLTTRERPDSAQGVYTSTRRQLC